MGPPPPPPKLKVTAQGGGILEIRAYGELRAYLSLTLVSVRPHPG